MTGHQLKLPKWLTRPAWLNWPEWLKWPEWFDSTPNLRMAKRVVVVVFGGTVTLIGVALLVLPGPAFIVIPLGLSILATEFLWASRLLKKAREVATNMVSSQPKKDES